MVAPDVPELAAPVSVPVVARPVDPSRRARGLGFFGSLLMAIGALGAGALPVPNPLFGLRVLGLPGRNVTLAIAVTYVGLLSLVLAWLWMAKMLRPRGAVAPAPTLAQLARTTVMWAVPLAVAPPMFSRDVYSYLAQSAIFARHLDPYVLGPAAALGIDDPLTRSIPTIWRDTPAPYGQLFLIVGRGITALTGDNIVLAIFAYRLLALGGLALIVWALPRLARRCGVEAGLALWLGAGNPLVLFHLLSGVHNEAIMIGLYLAGMEIGLRAGTRALDRHLLLGGALIVCASAVKIPALLALGFLGLHWAGRRGGRVRDVAVSAAVCTGVTVAIYLPLALGTGTGLGWAATLGVPGLVVSWMSLSTDLGLTGGFIGVLASLGDHTAAVLPLTRGIGLALAAGLEGVLLWRVLRGSLEPVTGVAAGLGAIVLLGPVVHPWYVLWGLVPLAATREMPHYRRALLGASAVLAVVEPPTGSDFNFRPYQLQLAMLAALVMLVLVLAVQRRMIKGRAGVDIDALPGHAPGGRAARWPSN